MVSKRNRVTKQLFKLIMKEGFVVHGTVFTLRYIAQKPTVYAFVAPKGIAKQAVMRNKMRRQGYSALQSLPVPSIMGIFFYKKAKNKATFAQIKEDIGLLLKKMPK